ncbi:MAG TPA: 3-hydroxyacyl-CoA dehydrogenase family protein [Gaiellaceae bacterium]
MRVSVIGAGLMGAQIGCEYAVGGHDVTLVARDTAAVGRRVDAAFRMLEEHGLATAEELRAAKSRIAIAGAVEADAAACDLAVESLPEDLELKAALLGSLALASPEAILATNTSSISITALGAAVGAPERVVGTHYLAPPLLMPPVEVVAGERTDPAVVDRMRTTLVALGKRPVAVQRDVPGFVWNRLQFALVRECVWLVEQGVASAETIDEVMRAGLARRWRHVGPFRAMALGGIDTWNRSAANIVPELSTAAALPDLNGFARMAGDLEADARARDAALARELRDGL